MREPTPHCNVTDHRKAERPVPPVSLERAARLFSAMGDAPRLRILVLLEKGELCVTEIVAAANEKFSTVSQRLRILRTEGLIIRRREGNHLFYALADRHVADLIQNALRMPLNWMPSPRILRTKEMSWHTITKDTITSMARIAVTPASYTKAMSITCTTAICITSKATRWQSTLWRSPRPTRPIARRNTLQGT